MAVTRREFISASGQIGGILVVGGLLGVPPATAASSVADGSPTGSTVVIVGKWVGLSAKDFAATELAVREGLAGSPEVAGQLGYVSTWCDSAKEGLVLAEWRSSTEARKFAQSNGAREMLVKAGGAVPDEVRVLVLS